MRPEYFCLMSVEICSNSFVSFAMITQVRSKSPIIERRSMTLLCSIRNSMKSSFSFCVMFWSFILMSMTKGNPIVRGSMKTPVLKMFFLRISFILLWTESIERPIFLAIVVS